MTRLELTDEEASRLRELLESRWEDVLKEIRHTDHREYRERLRAKATMLEGLIHQLDGVPVAAR